MLTKLVHQHLNKRLAEKRVEIEELIENYDEIILNSNKKLKKYYDKKKDILHEQIKTLRSQNNQYIKIVDTIIHITNLVGNENLKVIDCMTVCYTEKLRQQLLYTQAMVLKASITLVNEEIEQIKELTTVYKSQSDYHLRIHYLNNLSPEFKKLNIKKYERFEKCLKDLTKSGDSSENHSYKKVVLRLKNDQNFQKLKELDQRKKRLEEQKKKFCNERALCFESLKSQIELTQKLDADYRIKGHKYYMTFNTYFKYNTNTSELFGDIDNRISSLKNSMINIEKKRSDLEQKRRSLQERKNQERKAVRDKIDQLYKNKTDCHEFGDYSKFDYYKKEINRNKQELREINSNLNSSNIRIRELNEHSNELWVQYKDYRTQSRELKSQKFQLLSLLKKGLRDFHPNNIDYFFSKTLKPEIKNIDGFKVPKMKKLKYC